MHRWFLAPALLSLVSWVVAAGSLVASASGRTAVLGAEWATLVTLLAHLATLWWFGAARIRRAVDHEPEWVRAQEAKHRRKGTWFASWGLVVLATGWLVGLRDDGTATGRPGPEVWVGVSLNLGFQPGTLVAEWAALAAWVRLGRSIAG